MVPACSKHAKQQANTLVYGQVQIASPSRYEVLRHTDEEGKQIQNVASTENTDSDVEKIGDQETVEKEENETQPTRITLPRVSKNSHRFISASSQKARETIPRNQVKKSNRKH